MKRKSLIVALAFTLVGICGASAYTAAVGGEFALKVGDGLPSSALLSFRLPKFPAVFGLGLSIPKSGEDASFTLLADWWLVQGRLGGMFNYYVGPGVFAGIASGSAIIGGRVPVGVNLFPIKPLELFAEIAPAITLLAPSGVSIPQFGLQAGFGFRFWF
jgi:hypothetical protein